MPHSSSHRVGRNACQRPVQARLLTHGFARHLNRAFGRLRHVLQLQIFHGHPSVILCDGVSRLKHEVPTNVADTTMVILNLRLQSSALAAGLPLVERVCLAQLGKLLTSFLVAAELALKYGDLLFVLLDGFDIELEHRPVRERHRLGNAQINADLAGTMRTVVGEIHLRHDRDKPMPAFDGNRHLLDLALNRTRLSESHEACLRDADSTVGLVPIRRANLRNAEGIPVPRAWNFGKPFFLALNS